MAEPVIVTNIRCSIGENPIWHPFEKNYTGSIYQ